MADKNIVEYTLDIHTRACVSCGSSQTIFRTGHLHFALSDPLGKKIICSWCDKCCEEKNRMELRNTCPGCFGQWKDWMGIEFVLEKHTPNYDKIQAVSTSLTFYSFY